MLRLLSLVIIRTVNQMDCQSSTTNYLPWNISDRHYPPSCTSSGCILQLCKFHQNQWAYEKYGQTGRWTDGWMFLTATYLDSRGRHFCGKLSHVVQPFLYLCLCLYRQILDHPWPSHYRLLIGQYSSWSSLESVCLDV